MGFGSVEVGSITPLPQARPSLSLHHRSATNLFIHKFITPSVTRTQDRSHWRQRSWRTAASRYRAVTVTCRHRLCAAVGRASPLVRPTRPGGARSTPAGTAGRLRSTRCARARAPSLSNALPVSSRTSNLHSYADASRIRVSPRAHMQTLIPPIHVTPRAESGSAALTELFS